MTPVRTSRWLVSIPLILFASAAPSIAKEPRSALSGIFSNVQLSPKSGDLGGLEIEMHADALEPYAFVVFCEGWCNRAHRVPVTLNANKVELSFAEPYFDSSGVLVGEHRYLIEGRLVGRALIVDLEMNGHRERFRLRRQKDRFGLNVADPPLETHPQPPASP